MFKRFFLLIALTSVIPGVLVSCGSDSEKESLPNQSMSLVNRVWVVKEFSDVAEGTLYIFLSEGTLIIASENNKPGVGSWQKTTTGLKVVEDGIAYQVDTNMIGDQLTLIYHNPAGETKINLMPAS